MLFLTVENRSERNSRNRREAPERSPKDLTMWSRYKNMVDDSHIELMINIIEMVCDTTF